MAPGIVVQCRSNSKEKNTGNVNQIKNNSCDPIYLGAQNEAQLAAVESFGDNPQPENIDDKENGYRQRVEF